VDINLPGGWHATILHPWFVLLLILILVGVAIAVFRVVAP
jgi:hypothetical protein